MRGFKSSNGTREMDDRGGWRYFTVRNNETAEAKARLNVERLDGVSCERDLRLFRFRARGHARKRNDAARRRSRRGVASLRFTV